MKNEWILEGVGNSIEGLALQYREAAGVLSSALASVKSQSEAEPEVLYNVVELAGSTKRAISEVATTLLSQLSKYSVAAREAVISLSQSRRAVDRVAAIYSLPEDGGDSLHQTVLKKAIFDPSARVRSAAVDWVGRLRVVSLISELRAAEAAETNPGLRHLMRHELSLLQNGFVVEPRDAPGNYWVTVQTEAGRISGAISMASGRVDDDAAVVLAFKAQKHL